MKKFAREVFRWLLAGALFFVVMRLLEVPSGLEWWQPFIAGCLLGVIAQVIHFEDIWRDFIK